MLDLAIIGGGIAGLSAAYFAERRGLKWQLFDAAPSFGGVIRTKQVEDFLVENGPNFFSLNDPLLELIRSLGLEDSIIRADAVAPHRFIGSSSRGDEIHFTKAPLNPLQFIGSSLLTYREKLQVLAEIFPKPPPVQYEDMEAFISRKFGRAFFDKMIAAVLTGIYGSEPALLNPRYVLGTMYNLDSQGKSALRYISTIIGEIKRRRGSAPRGVFTIRGGISRLIVELVNQLDPESSSGKLKAHSRIEAIERISGDFKLRITSSGSPREEVLTHNVIFAGDHKNASQLFGPLGLNLPAVKYLPLRVVHCSVASDQLSHFSRALGLLVPPRFNSPLLGSLFMSNVAPERAPAGQGLITNFCNAVADEGEILRTLRSIFKNSLRPLSAHLWDEAIPQYRENHPEVLAAINAFEDSNPGIQLIGSWIGGLSLRDRTLHAKRAVRQIPLLSPGSLVYNESLAH